MSGRPGPGHNLGPPLDRETGWRRYAWARAKREIAPRAPLEVVRRHVARARALGLPYPAYAAIRLGTGRDVAALLLTGRALGWRRQGGLAAPAVISRLTQVEATERLLLSPAVPPPAGRPVIVAGIRFDGAAPAPEPGASWGVARAAVMALTTARRLPGDAVVMIGDTAEEEGWACAARLAGYLPAGRYFGAGT